MARHPEVVSRRMEDGMVKQILLVAFIIEHDLFVIARLRHHQKCLVAKVIERFPAGTVQLHVGQGRIDPSGIVIVGIVDDPVCHLVSVHVFRGLLIKAVGQRECLTHTRQQVTVSFNRDLVHFVFFRIEPCRELSGEPVRRNFDV